ncbi:MAG: sodium:solute symporter family protein [Candidatus Nanoarchaeia archaeon]
MQPIDTIIIFAYLIGLFVFAILIGKSNTIESFLVGNRKFKTPFLIFTMLSTMVGMTALISASAAAYSSGISFGVMSIIIILLGYIMLLIFAKRIKNFGDKFKAHTIGDYLAHRFSRRTQMIASITIMVSYFIFFSGLLLGLSLILKVFGGVDLFWSLIFAVAGVVIYTTISGIKSDFYTDVIHFFVMFITLVVILIPMIIFKVGGFSNLFSNLPAGYLNIYNFAGPSFFWMGMIFGFPLFLFCMEIWQRIFAGHSYKTVKNTLIGSALLTIPFVFLAMILGLVAVKTMPGLDPNSATFELIKTYLSPGILGLAIAGIIAAILSTLNSTIMVISACATKDIYISNIDKSASPKKQLLVGRLITLFVGIVGISIALIFPNLVELAVAGNEGLLALAPAILAGFLWKRVTEKAAFYSILSGFIVLWGSYPFIGKFSFIPAIIISILALLILTYFRGKKKKKSKKS